MRGPAAPSARSVEGTSAARPVATPQPRAGPPEATPDARTGSGKQRPAETTTPAAAIAGSAPGMKATGEPTRPVSPGAAPTRAPQTQAAPARPAPAAGDGPGGSDPRPLPSSAPPGAFDPLGPKQRGPGHDAPLVVDTSPGGCATGECLPEPAPPARVRGRDDPSRPLLDRWRAALDTVAAESPRHSASLKNARLLSLRDGEVGIAFRPDAGFHRTTVLGQSGRPVVERLLSAHFGQPTRLVLDETAGLAAGGKSVAEMDAEARAEHERATGQSVRNHPAILATLRILGGELEHIQVLERERTGAPGSDVIDEQP